MRVKGLERILEFTAYATLAGMLVFVGTGAAVPAFPSTPLTPMPLDAAVATREPATSPAPAEIPDSAGATTPLRAQTIRVPRGAPTTIVTPDPTPAPTPAPTAAAVDSGVSDSRIKPRDVRDLIRAAAIARGADPDLALRIAWCESKGEPWARNPWSGAAGLFQFLGTTWDANAKHVGRAGADVFDPEANADVAAWMIARGQADGSRGPGQAWAASVDCWRA